MNQSKKSISDFSRFLVSKPQSNKVNWLGIIIETHYDRDYNENRFEHSVYAFTEQEDLLEFCNYCDEHGKAFYITKNIPVPIHIRKQIEIGK